MRSRELRPFRVEIKTKRRTPAVRPPSIWGDAATHFKIATDQSERPPILAIPSTTVGAVPDDEPVPSTQARRILPDLRTIEFAVEPAAPVKVKRASRKKGGNIMLHDVETPVEHQVETSSVIRDDATQSILIETSSLGISDGGVDLKPDQAEAQATASWEAAPIGISTPTAMSGPIGQPTRRWMKETAELPRWEKWKRRLPQVCR